MAYEKISAKPLKEALFKMEGISERQIREHYTLYEGYVNKVNELRERLQTVDYSKANQTYSDLREMKVELTFALNGVKLHEAYFENLGGKGGAPSGRIAELIARDFGSFEAWATDLKQSGVCARGWVVCAYDLEDGKLFSYLQDDHNTYNVWNCVPIVVLDTYEHAYVIDYGVKRPPYLEAFFKNIDWNTVNARVSKL